MKCSKDHFFTYPAYDRDSDTLVCPTCRQVVELTEMPQDIGRESIASDNPIEEEIKDLRELVKTLTRRIERLEAQVHLNQKNASGSIFQKIQSLFRPSKENF